MSEFWYEKAKRLLRTNKVSQQALGELLGISKQAANHKLNGQREASIEEIMTIAGKLGMTIDQLCCDDPRYISNKQEANLLNDFRSMTDDEQAMFLKMMNSLQS